MARLSANLPKNSSRRSEQGNATVKFVAILTALFLIGFAGYNYITAWYQFTQIKDSMKESVDKANLSANPNDKNTEKIKKYLISKGTENNMPEDAVIKVERSEKGIMAHVSFSRDIPVLPFNLYNYKYQFDHKAEPFGGFLTK